MPEPDLRTPRLLLHAIDPAEGERIAARTPGPSDFWADDYPFPGDLIAVTAFLNATAAHGEQRPFGYYRITRAAGGKAIGGIGFKGSSSPVEVGYGLAPSARGHGYAAEALTALLTVAAAQGLTRVTADTTEDNHASRRTLEKAGFRHVGTANRLYLFEMLLKKSSI